MTTRADCICQILKELTCTSQFFISVCARIVIGAVPMTLELEPIGVIDSPYGTRYEAPPQGGERVSRITVFDEYQNGLKDIDGFSHLHIFYYLHKANGYSLLVKTPWDSELHGLFATRSPLDRVP